MLLVCSPSVNDVPAREAARRHSGGVAMNKVMGLLILAGLALGGCGNNDCEDAVDKAKECGLSTDNSDTDDCSGKKECTAKCIKDANCDQLKQLESLSISASDPIVACIT